MSKKIKYVNPLGSDFDEHMMELSVIQSSPQLESMLVRSHLRLNVLQKEVLKEWLSYFVVI